MVTALTLSGYRTRLTGLLGPFSGKTFPIFWHLVFSCSGLEAKKFSLCEGKRRVSAFVGVPPKAGIKRKRHGQWP